MGGTVLPGSSGPRGGSPPPFRPVPGRTFLLCPHPGGPRWRTDHHRAPEGLWPFRGASSELQGKDLRQSGPLRAGIGHGSGVGHSRRQARHAPRGCGGGGLQGPCAPQRPGQEPARTRVYPEVQGPGQDTVPLRRGQAGLGDLGQEAGHGPPQALLRHSPAQGSDRQQAMVPPGA